MTRPPDIDAFGIASRIHDILKVPADVPWFIAFSGGLDSTVLLHVLADIAARQDIDLVALHADHGLSRHARQWRNHCEDVCRRAGIEIRSIALDLAAHGAPGPEGRARQARYRWFSSVVDSGGWLFTAHHRGDQAETIMERLTRGAGPRGMRGMRPVSRIHGMNVGRPLLDVPRTVILAYARRHDLDWVTDDSNEDDRLTRNFVRHRVLPVLAERWPDIESSLARTANAMADAQEALEEAAARDLADLDEHAKFNEPSLPLTGLRALATPRLGNVLRYWIHRETGVPLGRERLNRVVRTVQGQPGCAGGMQWPPVDLRIYRSRLYLVREGEALFETCAWDLKSDLPVERGVVLRARRTVGGGLRPPALANGATVTFRSGGERCRLQGREHRRTLKNVMQEAGVPPWRRQRIPLIMVDSEIAAIPCIACCDPWAAGPGEEGIEIQLVSETGGVSH